MAEPEARYELLDLRTGKIRMVNLATTAEIMKLDPEDILWCIEEHGECEVEGFKLRERN